MNRTRTLEVHDYHRQDKSQSTSFSYGSPKNRYIVVVKETMVNEILSTEMIVAGEELTRRLEDNGFVVKASLWLYLDESDIWRLVIGTPGVDAHGPRKAYRQVQTTLSKLPVDIPKIPLMHITVIDSKDQLLTSLRSAIKTKDAASGVRFSRKLIKGTFIEDAYIYRLNRP